MDCSHRSGIRLALVVPLMLLGFTASDNIGGVLGQSAEQIIKNKILQGYNKSEPPEDMHSKPLLLEMQLQVKDFLIQNTHFASSEPVKLMVTASLPQSWNDDRLKWNPADFSTEDVVFVNENQVWTPIFALDNTFDEDGIHCRSRKCFVHSTGQVTCVSHCTFPARCDYDVRQWPYGTAVCRLRLGSWDRVNDGFTVNSFQTTVVTRQAIGNKHWRMLSMRANYTTKYSSTLHNKPFTLTVVTFVIERISTFYDICITAPAIVIACLNLIVLWLPLTNNMRYVIPLLALHGHFIFFQQLSWLAPSNGDNTPYIMIFLRNSMLLTMSMIVFITITRRLATRQDSLPRWIEFTVRLIDSQPLVALLFPSVSDVSCKPTCESIEDTNGLVHGEGVDPVPMTYNNHWRRFCLILERIYFIIYAITYAIMLCFLIPSNDAKPTDLSSSQITIME